MVRQRATDIYLTVGAPPTMRVNDNLITISNEKLDTGHMNEVLVSLLTTRQMRDFQTNLELNTAVDLGEFGRFRVNVLRQRMHPALVIRRIVTKIPSFQELRLPSILESLALKKRGLILFTGMTGSGKSTSLASVVDYRNESMAGHILTIEDPIEYYHEHKKSIVTQREIGVDTDNYAVALKNALRQRPDVILVGEIREREVMEQALTASETGHLCLSTIHTNNAYQAIERIINMFPEEMHNQIRNNLAANLRAIISQRLIQAKDGSMLLAAEVMLNEGLIRDLIVEGQITKIRDVMGANEVVGMLTFDQSLLSLYRQGLITEETAIAQSDMAGDMRLKIQKLKIGENAGGLSSVDTSLLKISD